ncbi:MAG: aminopeptidase P family protein [Deltaproteobacteria bacterium]|nr:aminopeptidase P family protein [Deltaproteobacteria bacterium]
MALSKLQEMVPVTVEITKRIRRLQQGLQARNAGAALIMEKVDLFYFSGTMQHAYLFVPADGTPLLMVKRDEARARRESPLDRIVRVGGLKDLPGLIHDALGRIPQPLGLELDVLPVNQYEFLQSLFPGIPFFDAWPVIRQVRKIKSPHELSSMARAGQVAAQVYRSIPGLLIPGRTEMDVAAGMTSLAMSLGHQNMIRARGFNNEMHTWHVVSGRCGAEIGGLDAPFAGCGLSPAFPAGSSLKPIVEGEAVLVDFGICLDGYQVDQTRMFAIGSPPAQIREAYQALQEIETDLLERVKPGVVCEEFYHFGLDLAARLGYQENFLGVDGYRIKFIGHGIGLEIGELPFLAPGHRYALEPGMTFALELKMVFPEHGAVGFENTILVTETGWEKLTAADERFICV